MEQSLLTIAKCIPAIFENSNWTFVDCGAFRGDFSENVIKMFSPAAVIMVEGNPDLATKLKLKFDNSSVSIEVKNAALSMSGEKVSFNIYDDPASSSLLSYNSHVGKKIEVQGTTLSSILQEIKTPVVLKTDLQGMDLGILQEAQNALKGKVQVCISEFIQYPIYENQGSMFELWNFMNKLDYHLLQITDLHSKKSGNLAFGNFVFVDRTHIAKINQMSAQDKVIPNEDFSLYVDTLRSAAEERLQLINRLDKECKDLSSRLNGPVDASSYLGRLKRKIKSLGQWNT